MSLNYIALELFGNCFANLTQQQRDEVFAIYRNA